MGTDAAWVSRFHSTSHRVGGVSWWGERQIWLRHTVYWTIALALVALTAADGVPIEKDSDAPSMLWSLYFLSVILILAIVSLVWTIREWEAAGFLRTTSRSLVLLAFVLGFTAAILTFASTWLGATIDECQSVEERLSCTEPASPRVILEMLAWHAANVVPVLALTDSFG